MDLGLDKLIFEKSVKGRCAVEPIPCDVPTVDPVKAIGKDFLRSDIEGFPELDEPQVMRHFVELSTKNFGVDTGFYPLGSCTMKYNPKINEAVARLDGFANLHPYAPQDLSQGALELIYELEKMLAEVTGLHSISLQPAAGAQGELCGMLMVSKYFKAKKQARHKVLIPDTAHGTNPASSHLAGFKVVPIKTDGHGVVSVEAVKEAMDTDVAALMLTNPNTLGLFETNIKEIAKVVHDKGGFLYCDGANMNAMMGLVKLGELGVDIVQLNLHKTFSTPHGGGGPGSGPVGVVKELAPYLPVPRVTKKGKTFHLDYDFKHSIGKLKSFYGNFGMLVRAYAYIKRLGGPGLKDVTVMAILNANYIMANLKDTYNLAFDTGLPCMHECVFTDKHLAHTEITTMDIAKRLIDYGVHPPTIYFPLVVQGAMMVEPTETESKETLDRFIAIMKKISVEAIETPELLKSAPNTTKITRVDETKAARQPNLKFDSSLAK